MTTLTMPAAREAAAIRPPARLHHAAYVCEDQERTRRFYEDVLGFPLVAFWIEREELAGESIVFSHAFYGLQDGSALAFFNFADPAHRERFRPKRQELFVHLALKTDRAQQDAIRRRLEDAGVAVFAVDHGYALSMYAADPDGQLIEFTLDAPDVERIDRRQRLTAHASLARWQAGDRTSNNEHRADRPHAAPRG